MIKKTESHSDRAQRDNNPNPKRMPSPAVKSSDDEDEEDDDDDALLEEQREKAINIIEIVMAEKEHLLRRLGRIQEEY